MLTVLPLGLTAPFGTTILGIIAISDIRHSRGRLHGLALALPDALLFPLLALDVAIYLGFAWLLEEVSHDLALRYAVVLLGFSVFALANAAIVRWACRAAMKPAGDAGRSKL